MVNFKKLILILNLCPKFIKKSYLGAPLLWCFPWNQKIVGLFWIFFLKISGFARLCDRRSFHDHSRNIWSTITHDHDCQNRVKKYLRSLVIVIWSEMIGDHDPISPTLDSNSYFYNNKFSDLHHFKAFNSHWLKKLKTIFFFTYFCMKYTAKQTNPLKSGTFLLFWP